MTKKRGELHYIVDGWDKLQRVRNEYDEDMFHDPEKKFTLTDTGLAEGSENAAGDSRVAIYRPYQTPPRKATRSYLDQDRPLAAKMKELVDSGNCSGPFAAALHFVGEAAGSGNDISKQRRLERSYNTIYGKK